MKLPEVDLTDAEAAEFGAAVCQAGADGEAWGIGNRAFGHTVFAMAMRVAREALKDVPHEND